MNSLLNRLHLYPFERLNLLLQDITPPGELRNIALSIGEPKHPAPDFIIQQLADRELHKRGLGTYPATKGMPELKQAIASWLETRFKLRPGSVDADSQVLPVNGTREALFAIAQAVIRSGTSAAVMMPNPFYQIYEGAAILAGAEPVYVNCTEDNGYLPDFSSVSEEIWEKCSLLYINSPGNPCGALMNMQSLTQLIEYADRYHFVIASDECYSEIYLDESSPPLGLLQACAAIGRDDFRRCLVFNSLSKRSSVPGLRSGLVAGDRELIRQFLLYRTYHGSAMPVQTQIVSSHAWRDEDHVVANRQVYREKFAAVGAILADHLPVEAPSGGFYYWAKVPFADAEFAGGLYRQQNVTVLPGSFLSRESAGVNPGSNRIRMALVAPLAECMEAAERVVRYVQS